MTTVVRHSTLTRNRGNYVYVGRPSKWGNPYTMDDRSPEERARVITLFRKFWYAASQKSLRQQALEELQGKQRGCFCHPLPWHGGVIAEWVNSGGTVLK